MSTYDPHSSVLDKIIFLKITTKFIYNISKILNNQMKITTPSIIFKKKIPKIFSIIMRNEGWKLKKRVENSGDPLPVHSAPPSKSCYAPQKCLKLFVVVLPTKNPTANQKNCPKVYIHRLWGFGLDFGLCCCF